MSNFYIYFFTWLNLIFVAAKLWDRIHWSWFWVMTPLIGMTVIGMLAVAHSYIKQNRMRSALGNDYVSGLLNFIQRVKLEQEKVERDKQRHTVN